MLSPASSSRWKVGEVSAIFTAQFLNSIMATIFIAWELGGGLGHLQPLSLVARRLREGGHRVILASRELALVDSLFGNCGVEYLQAPFSHGSVNQIQPIRTYAHILHNYGFGSSGELLALSNAWHNLFMMTKPDLLLADHSPSAVLAARRTSIKCASIGTGFFFPPDTSPIPEMWPWRPPDPHRCRQDEEHVLQNVNQLLTAWNQPPLPRLSGLIHGVDAKLLTTLPELDAYPHRKDADYYGLIPIRGGRVPNWPNVEGLRIFAYLKPFASLVPLLEVLTHLGHPTLVYLSSADPQVISAYESRNLTFSTSPVDMDLVRKQADCAILHGGHGSTLSMLLAGKPILQIPLQTEQAITSVAIETLQAGTWVTNVEKPHEVAFKLMAFLQHFDKYFNAAQRFSARYSALDPDAQLERLISRVAGLIGVTGPESR